MPGVWLPLAAVDAGVVEPPNTTMVAVREPPPHPATRTPLASIAAAQDPRSRPAGQPLWIDAVVHLDSFRERTGL